ncbi:sigma-54-dependent Fis family transcriptional regulator [Variovorax sp. J22R133]|uniref:sigma-54-dependent Fis family transcriptional regulator n=1 Tax=Variovorax brevis TaxID=3053503 RepID=UPI002574CBE5|nr:sigma-54-dependent Fis family transcriptional regulator [Variovorax sp. J22R133]MDM0115959.1 sigma-54-dependent Fis family transcriptional regulator [Variovorax sp. J22R133]
MALTTRNAGKSADPHADRVLNLVRGGFHDQTTDVVTLSWIRCLDQYHLRPDKPHDPNVIARVPLEERRARHAAVIECARYEMTTLYQQLADSEMAVLLTDTDGVILHMVSSPEFAAEVGPLGLRAGGVWSETEAGTNGMGTCLAAGSPVSVRREDHFYTQFTQLTCSAVPVFDPAGNVVAALDVTSRSSLMQQHLLVLLAMTARMIENRLIDRQFQNAHPLHFHSRPEFVYTLHEGKLAVGEDGRILAANRSAMFQLGLQSMDEIRSRRIEDLFQTSLADMLQRSASSSFHPVVTYGTDAALRFFAVARRPATGAAALTALPSAPSSTGTALAPISRAKSRPVPARPATAPGCTFEDPRLVSQLETGWRVISRGTPILLCGETGSGKEVFARALHEGSPHATGAFVAINCASLPEALIESELFGYSPGAFTGAQRAGRRGKILQADGGTLFLDEIADMPLELQSRLLRVLDERRVTPLGTEESHSVDFQLISASHRHLPQLVREGRFREDLYYRLAGIEVQLPPLRERSDRLELIRGMLKAEGGDDSTLSPEAERLLMAHPWPGNIRQLRHVLRTAAALADGKPIARAHLPSMAVNLQPVHAGEQMAAMSLGRAEMSAPAAAPGAASIASTGSMRDSHEGHGDNAPGASKLNLIQANERQLLLQMLEQHRWNVSNVAKALDVSRNTLYRKIHKLQIEVSHPEQGG